MWVKCVKLSLMHYFYLMLEIFRKHRFLLMLQFPVIVALLLHKSTTSFAHQPLFYIVWELVVVLPFLKYRHDQANQHRILQSHNNKLLIRGVWGKKEIPKDQILRLEVRRAFVARVFDWSQVIVTTKSQSYSPTSTASGARYSTCSRTCGCRVSSARISRRPTSSRSGSATSRKLYSALGHIVRAEGQRSFPEGRIAR